MIRYLFRKPKFPVICDAGVLVGATSPRDFAAQIETLDLPPDGNLPVVDASAKGWAFNTKRGVLSPWARKKRWTKKEVIALFNGSEAARKLGRQYSERSLSSKRFDTIFREIVSLIRAANKVPGDIGPDASNPRG